jgi:hypothetical protein
VSEVTKTVNTNGSAALARPRRVVTGHDDRGRSMIVSDGPAPHATVPPALPGMKASVLWVTDCTPASIEGNEDAAPADLRDGMGPPSGGTLLRIADFPPESEWENVDIASIFQHINRGEDPRDGVPKDSAERHIFFHKTPTIDYAIVLEGEIWALLDDGETRLQQGDVLIQRGTSHSWSNRSDRPARMAFILIDASDNGG